MATWGYGYDDGWWLASASASSGGGLPHQWSSGCWWPKVASASASSGGGLRPQTAFATVLAAIDANEDGDHVHITDANYHSRNCFPDEFESAMSNGFQIRVTIRKRPRDNKGRVTCKGARVIVEHAGHYMEKLCESLSQPREWYPKHCGRFQVVSFGARWLTKELAARFDQGGGDISTDQLREALEKQSYRPDLVLGGMRKFDDPETRDPQLRNHT